MKYRNVPTVIDGVRFDSRREASRWQALSLLQRGQAISQLERQVVYELAPKAKLHGEKRTRPAIRYVADFRYLNAATGEFIVEDTKGRDTPTSRLKRHLMKTVHGIDVVLS